MLSRIAENVVVAMMSAAVVWGLDHPGKSRTALRSTVDAIGHHGAPFRVPVLAVAIASLGLALLVQVWRSSENASWTSFPWELGIPSLPSSLLGTGVTLALLWVGSVVCANGNSWGLVPIVCAGWLAIRFVGRVRSAWASTFGL